MLFEKKTRWLIAGLGNPGARYASTRHNAGFICADALIDFFGAKPIKTKAKAELYRAVKNGREIYIVKPLTMMNLSGQAVNAVMRYYKIPVTNIIIIYDDVSLAPGTIRIRPKGSDGGHNGIFDIIMSLNTEVFLRIKIGVGIRPDPDYDLKDWVLSKLPPDSLASVKTAAEKTGDICELLFDGKLDQARNMYNG